MKYTHIVWDFNGTILNDVETGIKSINTLLARRNLPIVKSIDEYHGAFRFPVIEYYKHVGFDFNKESYEEIAAEWVAEYNKNAVGAKLYDGVTEALKNIKAPQYIISASEKSILVNQLAYYNILNYFTEIIGLENIYASSKITIALEWKNRIKPEKVLLIGDTDHDHKTALAMEADCILIAGGHQSHDTLKKCGVPVFNNIKEAYGFLFLI